MGELFGAIYSMFETLFGLHLAEHLWGYNCLTQAYDGKNLFSSIGLITALVSLVLALAYYYLPLYLFNHPRSNRWYNWLLILFIAGIVSFFIAYGWSINDFLNGNIGDCLMYTRDQQGTVISQHIFHINCILFGVTNFFVSSLLFVVWTFIFKWGSRNCKHSPIF